MKKTQGTLGFDLYQHFSFCPAAIAKPFSLLYYVKNYKPLDTIASQGSVVDCLSQNNGQR